MSDETKAPGEGEAGGLPPDVKAHEARMQDPVWKARLVELEADVHKAIAAVFAHAEGAAAVSIPVQLPGAEGVRSVLAGDPMALFAAIQGEGPRILLNKHVIVAAMNPKELLVGALMQMLTGRGGARLEPVEDDEEGEETPTPGCPCPRCEELRAAARAKDENKQH